MSAGVREGDWPAALPCWRAMGASMVQVARRKYPCGSLVRIIGGDASLRRKMSVGVIV